MLFGILFIIIILVVTSKFIITTYLPLPGMEPFTDFMPYPGCRIVILNSEKFESLPESVQAVVQQAFDIKESTGEEAQRINDALLQELVVQE